MTRIAIYPGSFDPPTRAHEDLLRRSLALADQVHLALAVNSAKQPLFDVSERLALLKAVFGETDRVVLTSFEGLLVDYARRVGASLVVRGIRAAGDFEFELQMAQMNRRLNPALDTVFLGPASQFGFLSSTLVREVARYGGDLGDLVHPAVAEALRRKVRP
jgi:pantetheine-phosphate adenylyltransferase